MRQVSAPDMTNRLITSIEVVKRPRGRPRKDIATTTIRISQELKNSLEENKHPGQSWNGFLQELLDLYINRYKN